MKTRVDGIRVKDDYGIVHYVSCRCPNGDFKRKFITMLANEADVVPTEEIVRLLGEVLKENQRLIARLKEVEANFEIATEIADDQYERIDTAREFAEAMLGVLGDDTSIVTSD